METTIDYKLGQISSEIKSLKEAQESHHEEDKELREVNHIKLEEVASAQAVMNEKFDNSILRWDSWKDGQTIYMHETTGGIKEIKDELTSVEKKFEVHKDVVNERLKPLEIDLAKRVKDYEDSKDRARDIKWSIIKTSIICVLALFIFLLLTNLGETRDFILNKIK